MNLLKASILTASLYIAFLIIGTIQTAEVYMMLREEMITKHNFDHAIKSAGSHVMDDFRKEKFSPLLPYSHKHLEQSLNQSEERHLRAEQEELLKRLSKMAGNHEIKAGFTGRLRGEGKFRSTYFAKAEISEKHYFFGYLGRYHREKSCEGRSQPAFSLFHSMEEAARAGFYPCETCILNHMR